MIRRHARTMWTATTPGKSWCLVRGKEFGANSTSPAAGNSWSVVARCGWPRSSFRFPRPPASGIRRESCEIVVVVRMPPSTCTLGEYYRGYRRRRRNCSAIKMALAAPGNCSVRVVDAPADSARPSSSPGQWFVRDSGLGPCDVEVSVRSVFPSMKWKWGASVKKKCGVEMV